VGHGVVLHSSMFQRQPSYHKYLTIHENLTRNKWSRLFKCRSVIDGEKKFYKIFNSPLRPPSTCRSSTITRGPLTSRGCTNKNTSSFNAFFSIWRQNILISYVFVFNLASKKWNFTSSYYVFNLAPRCGEFILGFCLSYIYANDFA